MGLNHLNELGFRHNFQDYVLVARKLKIYHITFCTAIIFTTNGLIMIISTAKSIRHNFQSMSDNNNVLLYGNFISMKAKINILGAIINYIENSERFSGSIFE